MHSIMQTQNILIFMSYTGYCWQQKHTQHAQSTKTECDYLSGWIEKQSHKQKSQPKTVNPRDIAGERRKRSVQCEKKHAKQVQRPGMPIFHYFPFFQLFLAGSVLHRSVFHFLYFLLFHLSLSELSVSSCVHFL